MSESQKTMWIPGVAPVAVVMLSLNEAHNMEEVLQNLKGWAQEVFLVDSYSSDETVEIALRYGVHVVQRKFRGFGDQWNFALRQLPISASWTMKLDPDERMTDELKENIREQLSLAQDGAMIIQRRLWFMGKSLPIQQEIVRVWKTGKCEFSDVLVNEHPLVNGPLIKVRGKLEHRDSPDLHHWVEKQNKYSSYEALSRFRGDEYAVQPKLFGSVLQRRMWVKKNFAKIPFRYLLLFLLNSWRAQIWRTGYEGMAWARLRVWVHRMREDKLMEMRATNREIRISSPRLGAPHLEATQYE